MKKLLVILLIPVFSGMLMAQKYAYVDTEYILNNIPVYESAKTQLDDLSAEWKKEIDTKKEAIDKMYKDYQAERVLLTEELRAKREEEIMTKEKEIV